jgi:hypothetical protein
MTTPAPSEPEQVIPVIRPGRGGARPGAGRKPKSPDATDPYSILAKARAEREIYRAQLDKLKYRQAAKELVPAAEFERALSEAFKLMAVTLESLPDVLERDCALPGPAVEKVQKVTDNLREDLYQRMVALG